MDTMEYLEKAVGLAGGQKALAMAINRYLSKNVTPVKQANVWSWLHRSRRVPPVYAIPIQLAVGGAVTALDLCPETFRPDLVVTFELRAA